VKQLEVAALPFPATRAEEIETCTSDADFAAWLFTERELWPEQANSTSTD